MKRRRVQARQPVRVIFCDAEAHDNGWMHPTDVAGRVRVRGQRDHAFLIPAGAVLPFPPRGPVFRFS